MFDPSQTKKAKLLVLKTICTLLMEAIGVFLMTSVGFGSKHGAGAGSGGARGIFKVVSCDDIVTIRKNQIMQF